jgi:hypothetical protein
MRREEFSLIPRGEEDYQGLEERAEWERRETILLYRAREHGVYPASH